MSDPTPHHDPAPLGDPADSPELRELATRLERERPVPSAAFRGNLRRALLAERQRRVPVLRSHYRLVATSYACVGVFALVVAALGVAGSGPFAA